MTDHGDVAALVAAGDAQFRAGSYEEAVVTLGRAVEAGAPVAARILLGIALGQTGRLGEGAVQLERAVELAPDNADAWGFLGTQRRSMSEYEQAETAYRRALAIDDRHLGATWGLGLAYGMMGRANDAVTWFRRAVEIAPDFAPPHFQLGVTLLCLGDRDGAMAEYETVRALDDHYAAKFREVLDSL